MPRKRSVLNPIKVTMILDRDSYNRMRELYPDVGAQAAIRALVVQHTQRVDASLRKEVEDLVKEIDVGEI